MFNSLQQKTRAVMETRLNLKDWKNLDLWMRAMRSQEVKSKFNLPRCFYWSDVALSQLRSFKMIVHPKVKITPWFTHPQAILGVYDFLLSDEYSRSYIKKCPGSSKLHNGSEWGSRFWSPKKVHPSIIKVLQAAPGGGLIKAFRNESMLLYKTNIHI